MGETVRQIFNDGVPKELYDRQSEKIDILEEVLKFNTAEQMKRDRAKIKSLEEEAIALRAADSEKDKLIAEKDKRIDTMQTSYENQLATKLEWQRRQFEEEKAKSLSDQRKNIRSKEVKPEKEKVEAANNERDRIQQMYESLLSEFNQVNEKLDTQTEKLNIQTEKLDKQTGLLYTILDILNSSNNIAEAKEEIDELITETKTALGIQYNDSRKPSKQDKIAFTKLVNSLSANGMTNKEIANKLYTEGHPFMITVATENAREQKVGRYLHKEY